MYQGFGFGGVGGAGGEWVFALGQGLGGWDDVMSGVDIICIGFARPL